MQFGLSASLFDAAYKQYTAGNIGPAEHYVRQALQADPRHADSLHLLGVIAGASGQPQASLQLFDAAIAESPRFASAHANRGVALLSLGRPDEALAAYNTALEIDPGHVHGNFALANLLESRGDLDGAEAFFRKTLAASPNYVEARSNLGRVLRQQGRLDEAREVAAQCLQAAPDWPDLHYNMGTVLQHAGLLDEAIVSYRRTLALRPDAAGAHSNILLALNYLQDYAGQRLLDEHRAFDAQHTRPLAPTSLSYPNAKDPERRLRIGYVSGDFHSHPVGYYLVGPLAAHDKSAFELFCYSNDGQVDQVTARIAQATDHWRDISAMPEERAAGLIRHDQIDILVDLSGHTDKNRPRLFGLKPAPVQVSWLGYPGTTGLSAIDYLVMDGSTAPPGADAWVSEALVRLPHGRFCYSPPTFAPEVAMPPARPVTFGSFNNIVKLRPEVVRLWAKVLDAAPGSRLLLKWKYFDTPSVRDRITGAFAAAGVGPDRLELRGGSPHAEMLAEYADVDIALDPFPFCGGLTSSEALWMGVPVVTLPLDSIASRQTLAFLHGLGLDDLAAASEDDYVRIAAALAADPDRRAELRQTLRPRMAASPMNDPKVLAAGLDKAYRQMWRRWCEGKAPEAITVEG
jgi:predicted O-linked N-acetylglucosamine transferase (SPINDLY family)